MNNKQLGVVAGAFLLGVCPLSLGVWLGWKWGFGLLGLLAAFCYYSMNDGNGANGK